MNNIIDDIGYETDRDDERLVALAKDQLLPWACDFGHVGCRNAVAKRLTNALQNSTKKLRVPFVFTHQKKVLYIFYFMEEFCNIFLGVAFHRIHGFIAMD